MKIKVIDFGYDNLPNRAHSNDAGADVYARIPEEWDEYTTRGFIKTPPSYVIKPHTTAKIPLGLGLELPDGYMACVYPRSGLSSKGIVCELPPIDSGYRGEIHAIVHNGSDENFVVQNGDRIGQLVVTPVVICDFVTDLGEERGSGAFGSTGR